MDIKGKRLRLLFADVLGVERGKYLFGDVADAGHSAFCVGVFPLTTDKEILDLSRQQFDVGLPDVEAFIDRDTLRPGWEEDTIVGIADVQQDGKALEVDPREVLRRAVEPWRAMGLEPMFAFESEFYLLERGPEGGWQPVELPSHRVYGTGTSVDPTGTIDAMVRAAQQSGFAIEGWASEFDTAAYEVNIRYADAIPAAEATCRTPHPPPVPPRLPRPPLVGAPVPLRHERLHVVAAEEDRAAGGEPGLDARDVLLPDAQLEHRNEPRLLIPLPHASTFPSDE